MKSKDKYVFFIDEVPSKRIVFLKRVEVDNFGFIVIIELSKY